MHQRLRKGSRQEATRGEDAHASHPAIKDTSIGAGERTCRSCSSLACPVLLYLKRRKELRFAVMREPVVAAIRDVVAVIRDVVAVIRDVVAVIRDECFSSRNARRAKTYPVALETVCHIIL